MNNLLLMQQMLMESMKRLNENLSDDKLQLEVSRSNALSSTATSMIKTINVGLSVMNLAERMGKSVDSINKELGITNEK